MVTIHGGLHTVEKKKQARSLKKFTAPAQPVEKEQENTHALTRITNITINPFASGSREVTIQQDDKILRRLQLVGLLGTGTQGKVFLVCDPEGNRYALKQMVATSQSELTRVWSEIENGSKLSHDSVIKIHDVYKLTEDEEDRFFILMDYHSGGDLEKLIEQHVHKQITLSEYQVACILLQLSDALAYIHSQKVIHRDLKIQNVARNSKNKYTVLDFGFSTMFDGGNRYSLVGTNRTMAPEIGSSYGYDSKVDIFSLGCIIFMMMSLTTTIDIPALLKSKGEEDTFSYLRTTIPSDRYDDKFVQLVMSTLRIDASQRPTAEEICSSPILAAKTFKPPSLQEILNTRQLLKPVKK